MLYILNNKEYTQKETKKLLNEAINLTDTEIESLAVEVYEEGAEYTGDIMLFTKELKSIFPDALIFEKGAIQEYFNNRSEVKPSQVVIIDNRAKFDDLLNDLNTHKMMCFDFETTSSTGNHAAYWEDEFRASILSITCDLGKSYIIPIQSKAYEDGQHYIKELIPYFRDRSVTKVAHNIKYDWNVLTRLNGGEFIKLNSYHDTMILYHNLYSHKPKGLKKIVAEYYPEFAGYGDNVDFAKCDTKEDFEVLAKYAAMDTDNTLRLFYDFHHELAQDEERYRCYRNIYLAAVPTFQKMEYRGAPCDRGTFEEKIKWCKELLTKYENKLKNYPEVTSYIKAENKKLADEEIKEREAKITNRKTGHHVERWKREIREIQMGQRSFYTEVNFGSPAQVAGLLYDSTGFNLTPPIIQGEVKRTTNKDYLKDYDTQFVYDLFAYRTVSKMLSTYYEGILEKLDKNGYIHPSFNLCGTVSGRISAFAPNLQNIPKRLHFKNEEVEDVLKGVTEGFIAPKGQNLIQFDLSQAEIRVCAFFSEDKRMSEVYKYDGDIHTTTAAGMLGVSTDEFKKLPDSKKLRYNAKAVNFSLLYLVSWQGYQRIAKHGYGILLSDKQAQNDYNTFFKLYTGIKKWQQKCINTVKQTKESRTFFGFKRDLSDIDSFESYKRADTERQAVNSHVQGTIGQYQLLAMTLADIRHNSILTNTVHDSGFVLDNDDEGLNERLKAIKHTVENLPIKQLFNKEFTHIKVDFEVGKNWRTLKEITL